MHPTATDDAPTPDALIVGPDAGAASLAAAQAAAHRLRPPFQGKTRRGYTTNKGKGASKAKRKQALASRRRNRGK
jgi:phosphoribosylpyrophosphate synthetase